VIVAVSHQPYLEKNEAYFQSITADNAVLVDIKGLYRATPMQELHYWSL
jgi:UDP-N-acetyl-D-galactosamine dehydrogenase